MNPKESREIAEKLQVELQVPVDSNNSNNVLADAIAQKLREVMAQSPEKLFQMFYLLDVSEAKVKQVIDSATGKEVFANLANLIVERELIRIRARK